MLLLKAGILDPVAESLEPCLGKQMQPPANVSAECAKNVEIKEVKYNILDFQLCESKMLCFKMRKMALI